MRELIEPGRNGLVLPTGDLDALAQAIEAAYRGELLGGSASVGIARAAGRRTALHDRRCASPSSACPRGQPAARATTRSCSPRSSRREERVVLAALAEAQRGVAPRRGGPRSGHGRGRSPASWQREPPDAVLLHYSVFAYSYRGLPLFVAPVLAALRRSRIPMVTVLHEFVYPWRHGGTRGKVWALTQRAVLIDVMRRSLGRAAHHRLPRAVAASRPWLPRRPAAVAPVFSNLPPPPSAR